MRLPLFVPVLSLALVTGGAGCRSTGSGGGSPAGASAAVPRVDLTAKAWFPPVQRQQGNSCAQQAGLYYLLTAERNRARQLSAALPGQRLSPYQAYATLAGRLDGGTHVTDGWHLARETGTPLEADLPRLGTGRGLMHGFDKYVRALSNRPEKWDLLPLRTEADLRRVKDLLAAGHPAACDFQVRGARLVRLPDPAVTVPASGNPGTAAALRTYVREWGTSGPGHNMVYAGYDDSLGMDLNGDGRLTNDVDLNGDGRITLADWERGAFLVVNPWGRQWGTGGKAWAPYRAHAVSSWPRAGEVAVLRSAAKAGTPRRMLRISLALKERRGLIVAVTGRGGSRLEPLPFRRQPLPLGSGGPAADRRGAVSSWEVFGRAHRPGPVISPGALNNPSGGPLEMGFDLSSLEGGGPYTLTLSTAGPALQGVLTEAAIVTLNSGGTLRHVTPFSGLPAVLASRGGTWTTVPGG